MLTFVPPLPTLRKSNQPNAPLTLRHASSRCTFTNSDPRSTYATRRIILNPSMASSDSAEPGPISNSTDKKAGTDSSNPTVANGSARASKFLRVCRVCKSKFDPGDNGPKSCRHHPQTFSGRLLRVTPTDTSDLAFFYDCCGAMDSSAPGCSYSYHEAYD